MKTVLRRLSLALLFASIFFACKKGDTGAAGAQGIKGSDGNTILFGKGAPDASLGAAGNFYIDQNASALYGPKTTSGWGSSQSLIGAPGANGTNGTNGTNGANGHTILSGNGAPAASAGTIGDFYFDMTNILLYGPKTASGWGGGLLLKGKDGNANVKTMIFSCSNLTWNTGTKSISTYLTVPIVTSDIINNGAVFVFFGEKNGSYGYLWHELEYTPLDNNGSALWSMEALSYIALNQSGTVLITIWSNVPDNFTEFKTNGYFKVVCVQGTAVTNNINLKDYSAVKKAFHLED